MQLNRIIFQLKCEWEKRYNGMKNKDFTLKREKFMLMISITIGRDKICEKEKESNDKGIRINHYMMIWRAGQQTYIKDHKIE